jgi:mannose-6-phosphate isomerase-like protein (cupin superfamily)
MQILELNATLSEFQSQTRANRRLGQHNDDSVGLGRYSGQSPWERHTNGDELLYVVDGEVNVEALTDGAAFRGTLRAGSLFIVPKGVWHQLTARPSATIFFVSPPDEGAERTREDPRARGAV